MKKHIHFFIIIIIVALFSFLLTAYSSHRIIGSLRLEKTSKITSAHHYHAHWPCPSSHGVKAAVSELIALIEDITFTCWILAHFWHSYVSCPTWLQEPPTMEVSLFFLQVSLWFQQFIAVKCFLWSAWCPLLKNFGPPEDMNRMRSMAKANDLSLLQHLLASQRK